MRSVEELYLQRNKYVNEDEYPHVYIDRERVWTPRPDSEEAPEHPGWLVMEVCGGQTDSKRQFMLNQIRALIYGVWLLLEALNFLNRQSKQILTYGVL